MRALCSAVARVSGPAVRVGERLAELESQRKRATEIGTVVREFSAMNAGKEDENKPMDREALAERARLLHLLAPVAAELDSPNVEKGKEAVENEVRSVETALTDEFLKYATEQERKEFESPADGRWGE